MASIRDAVSEPAMSESASGPMAVRRGIQKEAATR